MNSTAPAVEPVLLAKQVIACYVLGDTEGLVALLSPDAVCRIPGDAAIIPWAGTFHGRREVAGFHQRAKDAIDMLAFNVQAYEPHGDTVVLFARERCRVKATGKVFDNELVGIMTVADGHVVRYLEYADTAAMQAAFMP